jgi:pimeloyl-ACP methyl ester carboxylesterase
METVSKYGYYAIAFDLKGEGQTSKPLSVVLYPEFSELGGNYSFSFAGDEIVGALDAIGVDKFHLVSHDLGKIS